MVRGGSHCQVRVQFHVRFIKGKEHEKWFKVADLSPKLFGNYPPQMVTKPDLNIGFQGLALIQGQIYNPVIVHISFITAYLISINLKPLKPATLALKNGTLCFLGSIKAIFFGVCFKQTRCSLNGGLIPTIQQWRLLVGFFLSRQPIREPQKEYCWRFRNHPAKATRHGPKTM